MTVKEYIDAIVKISDERAEANELIKKKLEKLLADIEEQYKPAEPLIKDEKVRKAVRAWAEINGVDKVRYVTFGDKEYTLIYKRIGVDLWIQFENSLGKLVEDQFYNIDELCGEEK